jgi:uncharacterized protein YoxC
MVYEICTIIALIAFIVFLFFLIRLIDSVRRTLKHVDQLLIHGKTQLEPLSHEVINLLSNSNKITEVVHHQIKTLNPLLQSIENVGDIAEETTRYHKEKIHAKFIHDYQQNHDESELSEKIINLMELVALSVKTWQKIKRR